MSGIKVIINGDPELEVLIPGLEAMWAAGATSITIERSAPVAMEMSVIAGEPEWNNDCSDCDRVICPVFCRDARHQQRVEQCQREYAQAETNLRRAEENLREVVNAEN
jgi:hypothetical protein